MTAMPQLEVYCTVSNCHFWAEGEHCTALRILITTDDVGDRYPEVVDASSARDLVRQHGHTKVEACAETCCKTFTPRGGPEPAGSPKKREAAARHLKTVF